jgi:hypothetical protein
MCLVEFIASRGAKKKQMWIWEKHLVNRDAFEGQFKTIAAWKRWLATMSSSEKIRRNGKLSLNDFVKTNQGAAVTKRVGALAADDYGTGNCGYTAVGVLLEQLGYPDLVTKKRVEDFKAAGSRRRQVPQDDLFGITEKALRAFIQSFGIPLHVSGNKYHGMYHGVKGLKALNLKDGYYLVAGRMGDKGKGGTGHIFVLEMSWGGTEATIHEPDSLEGPKWVKQWLHQIVWVWRVDLVEVIE